MFHSLQRKLVRSQGGPVLRLARSHPFPELFRETVRRIHRLKFSRPQNLQARSLQTWWEPNRLNQLKEGLAAGEVLARNLVKGLGGLAFVKLKGPDRPDWPKRSRKRRKLVGIPRQRRDILEHQLCWKDSVTSSCSIPRATG